MTSFRTTASWTTAYLVDVVQDHGVLV